MTKYTPIPFAFFLVIFSMNNLFAAPSANSFLSTMGNYLCIDEDGDGNRVWDDKNGNGIQDNEAGIQFAEVTQGITVTYIDSTDVDGAYSFNGLMLDEDYNGLSANVPTYTLRSSAPAQYEPTDIGSGSDPKNPTLPVELLYFEGKEVGCAAKLTWATSMEHNSSYFQIERSIDGQYYTFVAKVNAAGFSTDPLYYSFFDENYGPFNYYRLKQVDVGGAVNYASIVVPIKSTCPANVPLSTSKVFPNPVRNVMQLQINVEIEGEATWSIRDNLGREVMSDQFSVDSGHLRLRINVEEFPVGVYFLELKNDNFGEIKKFIKIAQ